MMVTDYAGPDGIGMPPAVRELEEMIDRVAETRKWVDGDGTTLAALKAEGWNFRATDDLHLSTVMTVAQTGSAELLKAMLKAGMRADNKYGCWALDSAADDGDAAKMALLTAAKAPPQAAKEEYRDACVPLETALERGKPRIVKLLLDAHADPNGQYDRDRTMLMFAVHQGRYQHDGEGEDFAECVRLLIAAGADVNARNEDGDSALMLARDNADIVKALLKAGAADIDRGDAKGRTPLMRAGTFPVMEVLLEAGADPYLKDKDGKTALDLERDAGNDYGVKMLEDWMKAHPRK